ncbi:hemerythrin domain-containing protein [Mangrovibacterium lignilyticum]|uniref:hemerythrin domain-containing protein n=1 Tax=Mangrovibacterium lignilyticum TaxID=2668052 RepID=UPI0013D15071|nr:hemerythrin domain-containing protein [Mangrovibacterium lignilyticum]
MKIFKKEDKMSSLVSANSNLLPVINRFGIQLGFKEKTIQDICKEKEVNPDFFLAIVNTYTDENYFPEEELLSFSPLLLIDYLKNTHNYYIGYALPKIERLLENIMANCGENYPSLKMISSFYQKYKTELLLHLKHEDEKEFPYIVELYKTRKLRPGQKSITEYENEHTDVEEKLSDLKNLLIKYVEPGYNHNDMNEFLQALFQFEKDLYDHARIEDAILIKQVSMLENELKPNEVR